MASPLLVHGSSSATETIKNGVGHNFDNTISQAVRPQYDVEAAKIQHSVLKFKPLFDYTDYTENFPNTSVRAKLSLVWFSFALS